MNGKGPFISKYTQNSFYTHVTHLITHITHLFTHVTQFIHKVLVSRK